MKKPPAELIKQTNIAHTQQVNNHRLPEQSEEKRNQPNELLEKRDNEQRLDRGTPKEAVRVDSDLETVEAKHRAKNG
jgi:hypothetical protein